LRQVFNLRLPAAGDVKYRDPGSSANSWSYRRLFDQPS
jgi:hypothetical protein